MKFKDAYRSANDSVHVRPELLEEIKYSQAKTAAEAPKKRRAWWIAIPTTVTAAAVACLAIFVGLRTGLSKNAAPEAPVAAAEPLEVNSEEYSEGFRDEPAEAGEAGFSLKTFDSYEAILEQIVQRRERETAAGINWRYFDGAVKSNSGLVLEEAPAEPAAVPAPMDAAGETAGESESYRSEYGTNVQVTGVDEADIVKTDGQWIYCLNRANNCLYVVRADGVDSALSASVKLREAKDNENAYFEYHEMLLANDKLYVIGTEYDWSTDNSDGQATFIDVYKLGDRTKLKKADTLKQEGAYRTARLIGDTLVTVSAKSYLYIYKDDIEIRTWCPYITTNGEKSMLAPNDIFINEDSRKDSFVLITTVDTASGKQFDSHKAMLGGSDVVYCSKTDLLIASNEWECVKGEEQTDANGKHFVKNVSRQYTSLSLFDIKNGKIEPVATQKIEGTLLNQFSMDAYNDTYRLVVTRDSNEETIWTDGIDTYEYKPLEDCALYVLDRKLDQIGLLENVAENERVQSVRFMGDVAYFVTFRQVDPLFAVDLSEPTKPAILSALKIPGFSAYLHPFGEGRLIGIGYSADEQTGVTDGVKLTLFDISDPADVKVLQTKKTDASYTTVQYNHKAVFADAEKGVLAFPADDRYYVFKVSDDGISETGAIDMGTMYWDDSARGIVIGEDFYVVASEAVVVLSFDSIKKLAEVSF